MTALLLVLAAVAASLAMRAGEKKRAYEQKYPEHAEPSLLSLALQDILGVAGGIYLSLVLLVSFLQLDLPDRWLVAGVKMEPLAFLALSLAVVQPFFLRFYQWLKGG